MHYKELQVWQRAMHITRVVYQATEHFPIAEHYGLRMQMRRCAVSIPSNIAEGSQRGTDKDFARFILIARGSLAELETQVLLAVDLHLLNVDSVAALLQDLDELSRMLHAFRSKLVRRS